MDGLVNPSIKLEREKSDIMFIALMKLITASGFCPNE
jgi:hypothetical protein